MKKIILSLFFIFGLISISNAQPANDDCTTAQNIGVLPAAAACPGAGLGAPVVVAGTIVGATEANPYLYQPGCSGAGGPNMGVPAFDVWYTFTASAYQMQLTINSTFGNPNVAMYSGTCGALGGGVGGCAVGAGGTVSLTVEQMVPGTTYYLQVSGNTGQTGTFNLSIQNNRDCADCLIGSGLVINPLPVNGMYNPGQVVNFCYTVNDWSEINTNWLHGVQITYGSGWAGLSNPIPAATVQPIGGNWVWYPAGVVSVATGLNLGPGFYFNMPGGNAGNNFGDHCGTNPPAAYLPCPPAVSWTFCWDMTVAAGCSPGSNLSVTVNTSGDGESGSWNNIGCVDDPPTIAPAIGACCPPNMAGVDISCPGANDGQATVTPVGAAAPYDYTWNGPGGYTSTTLGAPGSNTITNLSTSGVYTVTMTDNINCIQTATVTINVGALPVPVPNNTGPYCVGANINLSVNAGFIDWDWTGPGGYVQNNTQNPVIAGATLGMAGLYTVTVTNASGCTGSATTNVVVNPSPTANATNTGPYCEGATIQLNSVGGSATDDWTGPGGYVANNTQNPTRPASTVAMSGVYTVTVTAGGCSSTSTTTVVVNPSPVPVANNTGPYCVGDLIQLNSVGGSATDDWAGPLAYNQPNTQNPTIPGATVAMTGLYTVTATTAAGCTATATTNVVVNALPVPVAGNTGPYCVGTNINLTVGGGFTDWDWTGPSGYNQPNTQNPVIPGATLAMAGDYTVTVTNAAGCTATATTTVVVNLSGVIAPGNTGPYCVGATIDLNAPGGALTYDWVGPSGYNQPNTQNPSIPGSTLAMAGDYTVTATYAGGCTSTGTTTVVINALPVPAAISNSPICAGSNLNLGSNGGVDYDWLGPNAYNQPNTQNPTIAGATVAATGIYTVTVSDAIGCSATATVNVVVNPTPVAVAGNTGPVCEGSNLGLNSNGGTGYAWNGPGAYADPTQNPVIVAATPAQSGNYTVTVTDANGCSNTAVTVVVINALPVVNANTNTPICDGLNINLSSSGATNYAWVGPNGFASGVQNPVINNAAAINNGIYTVTGTDANGCTATATVNVITYPNPTALFVGNPLVGCVPLCVDLTDQSVGNGGVITSWSWNVQGQSPSANQNETFCFNNPGTYDAALTVTTADGCSSTLSFLNYINASPLPIASFIYTPQEIVELHPDVTFASNSTGATGWLWDFGDGGFSNIENPVHSYQDTGIFCITLIVNNNQGCLDTTFGCLYVQPEFSLYIPNTFTVNDDGLNEIWQLYGRGIKKIEVRIFDRWGEELYYFNDILKGWPGTRQNGAICKQDVYVFRVVVTDPSNDEHTIIGNVNLIR